MKYVKLFVLAITIGTSLFVANLVFPERIHRAFSDASNGGTKASATDIAVVLESIGFGFTIGFAFLLRFGARVKKREFQREIWADKREIESVSFFLTGLCFMAAGFGMISTATWQGLVQIVLGMILAFLPPLHYIYRALVRGVRRSID